MSEARNFEEYRTKVLEILGQESTPPETRNFESWRYKVLTGLSADPDSLGTGIRYYRVYREEILKALGQTYETEDTVDTDRWRAKVLDGLGQTYETEDIVNFERWRLKVLKGLDDYAGGERKTATGTDTLSLTEVIKLLSIIQHGKTVQDGTPTPSAPVDIRCNNGAVRMVHRSGLPSGYKLLEYVGGSGSQYVITDLYLASTDVIECEYRNSSASGYGAVYGVFSVGESSALYGNQTYYGYNVANNKVDTDIAVNTEWHSSRHDFVNGTLTIDDTTVTFTPFEFVNSTKNAVLSRYYNNNYGYNWKGYVRKFKVTRNGEVVCDLLPAKDSNDVAGLYDLVTGAFYTAVSETLLEGNEVDDYELQIVGTPEVLKVNEQTASVENLYQVGEYEDTQEVISGAVTRRVGIKVLTGEETMNYTNGTLLLTVDDSINTGRGLNRVLCSHYRERTSGDYFTHHNYSNNYLYFHNVDITSLADWRTFFASQYAQGTPVIVLYPLAEEVTEQTTPQPMDAKGNVNISAISDINGIKLDVEYKGKKGD